MSCRTGTIQGKLRQTDHRDERRLLAMLELNIITLTVLTRRLLPPMLERGHGAILNVGSTAGFQGGPFLTVYAASKAYVNNFTEGLATELEGTGITVSLICPGATRTEFFRAADIPAEQMLKVSMDSPTVAAAGLRALEKGQVFHIPGVLNKLLVTLQRAVPRGVVRRVTRVLFRELNR